MLKSAIVWAMLVAGMISLPVSAGGKLTKNIRINSQAMGYPIQMRVYIPEGTKKTDKLPAIYVTDGQWYLKDGEMARILDETIAAGQIKPVIAVFVDSANPDDPKDNRRNGEFMCNTDYALFFKSELVPTIDANFPVSRKPEDRVIMGLSFGGLNAGCFGLMIPDVFNGIGMQSPASGEHVALLTNLYTDREKLPLKMFLSVGTDNDNTRKARHLKRLLTKKKYDLTYREVRGGHDWGNWQPLIDDLLVTFFGTQ